MNKINLIIALHNHQPVGNFDFVFKNAYERAYNPFLQMYKKHSHIKIVQHYTGILFDWIKKNQPDFFDLLAKLISNNGLEMMTGGYYEPILTTVPDRDKIGQIQKLSRFIKTHFDYAAKGIWIAERVWEPDLPEPINKAGIQYTAIDDTHFKYAGLEQEELYGYYLTEHNGYALNVFPVSEKLRYTIPFQPPEATIEYLSQLATPDGDRLVVFADDGEKFGIWPETYALCYERGWLDRFFTLLAENDSWINVITFKQALKQLNPAGKIYLPTASYREMMEWALPAKSIDRYERFDQWLDDQGVTQEDKVFVRGGFWRNFLAKYPESNQMHKRMLLTSQRLHRLLESASPKSLQKAKDLVYAAQCNCPYWHGVFGGLYLPHLRHAIYNHLIRAECEMDRIEFRAQEEKKHIRWTKKDVDVDGQDDYILDTDQMTLFFSPFHGGRLSEWDFKSRGINLLDTMSRRREGYHQKLYDLQKESDNAADDVVSIHDRVMVKEEGLEKRLYYDWYRRLALIDHFFAPDTKLEDFFRADYGETGDFVDQPYDAKVVETKTTTGIEFSRQGHVKVNDKLISTALKKKILLAFDCNDTSILYEIQNRSDQTVEVWFATEFPFSLLAGNAPDRYYKHPDIPVAENRLSGKGEIMQTKQLQIHDDWLDVHINFQFDKKTDIWRFPIDTISMSEAGFERVYQCSVVVPNWKLRLQPQEAWQINMKIELNKER